MAREKSYTRRSEREDSAEYRRYRPKPEQQKEQSNYNPVRAFRDFLSLNWGTSYRKK